MGFLKGGVEMAAPVELGYPNVLVSYFYDKRGTFFTDVLGYNPAYWLGDSGAFSAWTMGQDIDLDDYIEWCKRYVEIKPGFQCVSLDVIAGSREDHPTAKENEKAMKQSVENGDLMRSHGLPIMEVYHQWEPLSFLDQLLDRRQPGEVLGISPRDKRPQKERQAFCDSVFAHVKERCGWGALPPMHGLGVSPASRLTSRYPWWSVDASTWVASAQYGREVSPQGKRMGQDKRNSNRDLRKLYLQRTLAAWIERERLLTRLWQGRGVRYADTPDDALTPA